MRRAERLFQLIHLLSRRRMATAAELGERLEVSPRTVYRDIAHLIGSGVPISGEAGVGYRLDPSYRLPPLMFTPNEAEALVIGMRMIETWGDDELAQAARSVLDKVATVVPHPTALDQTALFSLSFSRRGTATLHLKELRSAVNARRKVTLHYLDARESVSQRLVRPLGLFFWGQTWTLAAWCELRTNFRNFRLDRIAQLVLTEDDFELVSPCTLHDYRIAMLAQDDFTAESPR
jgi:predicted DNA-binding transcriptional regulator YafY